ncbi:glycosyltransferase family 2 protein, partial [Planctomycetota bacterium]
MDKKACMISEKAHMSTPLVSVIVPVYKRAGDLQKTLESLAEQTFKDFELIVIDDASPDNSKAAAKRFTNNVIVNPVNKGPAYSRNRGIESSQTDLIVCIDSDCIAACDWLETIYNEFQDQDIDAVMGKTSIPHSTFLGDSIAALGYPGGANAGFENMWHVDENGFTDHITSCNFAARKDIFEKHGMFDEGFPMAGGEDSELSVRWSANGVKIKYCPDMKVYHKPITSLKHYMSWMIHRGRCGYHLKKKIGSVKGFLRLRLGSSWRIAKKNIFNLKIFLIILLICMMFVLQQTGYILASLKKKDLQD